MNEHYFFVHPDAIVHNTFSLSKKESLHFLKSLRGQVGDQIWLLDSKSKAYQVLVEAITGSIVTGRVIDEFPNYGESRNDVHLIVGLIKGKRMEIAVEKAVELGVKSIHPILFERCIRRDLNISRFEKIIKAAAKQSGRSYFPQIYPPVSFAEWNENQKEGTSLLCHHSSQSYVHNLNDLDLRSVNVIVGPEGDFSLNEISMFQELNIPSIKLSSTRLRSDSASLAAIMHINQAYQIQYE